MGRPLNGSSVRKPRSITPDPEAWERAVRIATANGMSVSQLFDMLVNEEWSKEAHDGDEEARAK